jgi:hypothetical protein
MQAVKYSRDGQNMVYIGNQSYPRAQYVPVTFRSKINQLRSTLYSETELGGKQDIKIGPIGLAVRNTVAIIVKQRDQQEQLVVYACDKRNGWGEVQELSQMPMNLAVSEKKVLIYSTSSNYVVVGDSVSKKLNEVLRRGDVLIDTFYSQLQLYRICLVIKGELYVVEWNRANDEVQVTILGEYLGYSV